MFGEHFANDRHSTTVAHEDAELIKITYTTVFFAIDDTGDGALSGIVTVPKEIADATCEIHAGEAFVGVLEIDDTTDALVRKHVRAKLVQSLAAAKPSGRDDHRDVARVHLLGLFHELLVDRGSTLAEATVPELVWRIADDDIELHVIEYSFRLRGMDKLICIAFQLTATVVLLLWSTTEITTIAGP